MNWEEIRDFYGGKSIFITGNTGFKGSWLTKILLDAGADVTGYSLEQQSNQNLYSKTGIERYKNYHLITGDIRNLDLLRLAFETAQPEIVFHLAAQPIVRDSYRDPVYTYSTNVMGTVNILECVRIHARLKQPVRSFLNVTTDKVYKNNEWEYGYREIDPLDGHDPYSNSKSCSELVTHSYKASFFSAVEKEAHKTGKPFVAISTVRAGNVIGGGDFAADRIIPDSVRALQTAMENGLNKAFINVRNSYAVRPYQHVLEAVFSYLMIAKAQYENGGFADCYNIGPDDVDCVTTGKLVTLFCDKWNKSVGYPNVYWQASEEKSAPHEADLLKLDCSKVKSVFGWYPKWHIEKAIEEVVKFSEVWMQNRTVEDYRAIEREMEREINEYVTS